jgi:hypothetical protein
VYVVIVLVASLLSAVWGYYKGLLHLVLRVSALLLAYVFTWQEAPHFAAYITAKGWLSGVAVWPVASTVLFFVGSVVASLLARWLGHVAPEEWHARGRLPGAVLGSVIGCALGLLLVWTTGALLDGQRLRAARQDQGLSRPNATVSEALHRPALASAEGDTADGQANQLLRDLSSEAMATVTQKALGDSPAAQMAARMVRNPVSVGDGLQHLAAKPELRALFENPQSYAVLTRGSTEEVMRLPDFQALTDDEPLMQFLSTMGLKGEALPEQSKALAGMLSQYARNFESLRSTPEFQSLMQDPDLREKLQQGNLMVLLTHEKVRLAAEMLVSQQPTDTLPAANTLLEHAESMANTEPVTEARTAPRKPVDDAPVKPLYRWKDSGGRLHITEEKPPEGVQADVINAR